MATIQEKNQGELMDELASKREAVRKFRFDVAGSKIRNVKTGKNIRREIAQILTELSSRNKKA